MKNQILLKQYIFKNEERTIKDFNKKERKNEKAKNRKQKKTKKVSNSIMYSSHATTRFNFGVIVPMSYDEYIALVKSGNVASKHVNG